MAFHRFLKYCRQKHPMHPSWKVCPNCLRPVVGWLRGINGPYLGISFPILEGKTTIGRLRKNDITLNHATVSPEHAFIKQGEEDVFLIADLNASKGTFVNASQINDDELIDNFVVKFGELEFIFKCIPRYLMNR